MNPKISVCIPVFRSEKTLPECLESVTKQTFRDFEVVIVDDCSDGKDDKRRSAKKIAKEFSKLLKKEKIRVEYIRHSSNLGLLEARRTLVEAATGDYILMLDSDDELFSDSLESLFASAKKTDADITHGKARAFLTNEENESEKIRLQKIQEKAGRIEREPLKGGDIRRKWLLENSHTSYLWGKLIKREIYASAFEKIPFVKATMAEDVLQYFFITSLSKSYVPLDKEIYRYRADSGITSNRRIETEEDWERVAQTADIFTAIFAQIDEGEATVDSEEESAIAEMCRNHLANNIVQMELVSENLKERAREILSEHWGENFVQTAEKQMEQKPKC